MDDVIYGPQTRTCRPLTAKLVLSGRAETMEGTTDEQVEAAIKTAFTQLGYATVRAEQKEAAREFVKGRDVFVSIPTGSGKSLCYGCLPIVFDILRDAPETSIVIVVSPLKALMLDQVEAFTRKGMRAVYVGAEDEKHDSDEKVRQGGFSLVFMSPEALVSGCTWRETLRSPVYQRNLAAVVVDEAHCIEKWLVRNIQPKYSGW